MSHIASDFHSDDYNTCIWNFAVVAKTLYIGQRIHKTSNKEGSSEIFHPHLLHTYNLDFPSWKLSKQQKEKLV